MSDVLAGKAEPTGEAAAVGGGSATPGPGPGPSALAARLTEAATPPTSAGPPKHHSVIAGDMSTLARLSQASVTRVDPSVVLQNLPPGLIRQLPALLGEATTSDAASSRTAEAIVLLVQTASAHKPLLLREMESQLHRSGSPSPVGTRCWLTSLLLGP